MKPWTEPQLAATRISYSDPPRAIRKRKGRGWALLFGRLIILPHMCVGVMLIGAPIGMALVYSFGDSALATVTSHYSSHSRHGYTYHIHYTYVANGHVMHGREEISAAEDRALTVGALVQVQYLAFNGFGGSLLRRSPRDSVANIGPLFGMALFWNGILSGFVWLLYVAPWRRRWLVARGEAIPGRITGKFFRSGKSTSWYVEYVSAAPLADPISGKMAVTRAEYAQASIGDDVQILFDPRHPRRNIVYEFADYEAVFE